MALNCGPARLDRVTLEEIKAVKALRRWPVGAAQISAEAISEPTRAMTCHLHQLLSHAVVRRFGRCSATVFAAPLLWVKTRSWET